ncbi:MAG: hypothetical protein EXX96DRAFT_473689, partial [Benjaminiella poitrasii]
NCGEHGHYTKKFSKCNLYKSENADQVGTSRKRKQPDNVKREKKLAKRKKVTDEKEVECKRCKMPGHSTARSPQCPFNILRKSKVMDQDLRQGYMAYTRKIPFDNCVHDAYMDILKTKIITMCRDIRHIILRAKIFVNFYVLQYPQENLLRGIFHQQFWYTVCQLTRLVSGASQCLAETCTELSTSYTNAIVEHFEKKLIYYLKYRLQNMFVVNKMLKKGSSKLQLAYTIFI